MVRTVTETITKPVKTLGIDGPPMATNAKYNYNSNSPPIQIASFGDAIIHVGLPAFGSTIMFLTTAIAVFLATAAVTYLILQARGPIVKIYSGKLPALNVAQDKIRAVQVASTVTLCHVLTILVLVIRTREGLVSCAPVSYEVCALILGIEAGVCVVLGAVLGVVRGLESLEVGGKKKGV